LRTGKTIGWTIYVIGCADGTYAVGMCRNIDKRLAEIGRCKGAYFHKHSERLPVKILFIEKELQFKEAYAKYRYMRSMPRKQKEKLILRHQWPLGGPLKEYLLSVYKKDRT